MVVRIGFHNQVVSQQIYMMFHLLIKVTEVAVGDSGIIIKTTNGGTNWIPLISETENPLRGVKMTDISYGYAVGEQGTILKTTNGGTSWFSQSSGTNNGLRDIDFFDSYNGIIVGDSGKILQTTDGGIHWEQKFSGTINDLYNVFYIDLNKVFIVGDLGIILGSSDSGSNWICVASQTQNPLLNSIFFTDVNQGIAVGTDGIIIRTKSGGLTDVIDNVYNVSSKYSLEQNYPNPFNPTTTINYEIPERGFVTLKVYDILGREVTILINEEKPAGSYEVQFTASGLTSGIYFYQIKAGEYSETKKMILLK